MSALPTVVFDHDDPADLGRIEVGGLRIVGGRFQPRTMLPPHHHRHACLTVALRGVVEKTFASAIHAVAPPAAVAMPPGESHRARFGRCGADVLMVEPTRDTASALGEPTRLFERVQTVRDPIVTTLGWRIRRELADPDGVTPLAIAGLAFELLAVAARHGRGRGSRPRWVTTAEDYLRAHFNETIELAALATTMGQPVGRLARQFTAHVGVSPGAFVRRLRIEWATRELASGERPLSDIALEAGFADQSHFTRAFRRQIGTSPGRFRRATRG